MSKGKELVAMEAKQRAEFAAAMRGTDAAENHARPENLDSGARALAQQAAMRRDGDRMSAAYIREATKGRPKG